jgi:S1-C subfamily serine protease
MRFMAKASPKADPPASIRPAARPNPNVLLAYRVLKLAAFVVGLPAALLSFMALIGAITDNGWARAIGGGLLVLGIPLAIADRLLPDHDPTKARGLVSDVCSVTWMLVVFVFAGLLGSTSRSLFVKEGDRLVSAGYPLPGRVAYVLAGVTAEIPEARAVPVAASGSASGSAATSASAPIADAGAAPVTSASASAAPVPSAKPNKADKTPAEIFKELSPSVVTVFVKAKMGEGGGTGFLVDKDGIIATNHHVIDSAMRVRIKFMNGAIFDDVELLADEPALDLALLKVDLAAPVDAGPKPDAAPLNLGDSEKIEVGERAVSIGNPLGLEHTLTDGLVSSRRIYENRAWIQFSAPISPGNSGGPLFNMRGEVIGITTATLTGHGIAQNLNLAVPVNELKKLFKPSYPGRRKFGDGTAPSQW